MPGPLDIRRQPDRRPTFASDRIKRPDKLKAAIVDALADIHARNPKLADEFMVRVHIAWPGFASA